MSVGHLTGRSVTELRFRIRPNEEVHLGEILISDGPKPFYLRVVDLEYGADARDGGWEDRVAGNLLAGHDVELFDADQRLYKTAVAAPLGYLTEAGFRKPKTLPPHFAAVRRPREGDFKFLAPKKGDLVLGHLRSGDEALPDLLGIEGKSLSQHIGIFATTGMGKSNLLKVLAASCLESGRIGLLVLDPHGEYADGGAGVHPDGTPHRGLLHHPRRDRLHVFTSRPIAGHSVHTLQMAATEIEPNDFQNVYNLSGPQEEALWAMGQRFGKRWLLQLDAMDVESLDQALGEGKFHPGTLNVLKRRAEQVMRQGVIHSDEAVSTTPSILHQLHEGHVVLVDTSGLFPTEELLVSAVLARSALESHRRAYRNPDEFRDLPPICITLEEAQRVLNARGGSQNVFAQIAREGRKFKVGLGAVTQQPRLISDELLSQFNTQFILGLADPTDRDRVKSGLAATPLT